MDLLKSNQKIIGIFDTGLNWQHPDYYQTLGTEDPNESNIWQNLGEDADGDGRVIEWDAAANTWIFDPGDTNSVDDDGNGYVDDFVGWDFNNNDNDPFAGKAHGNIVSSVAGARTNNQRGMAGSAFYCKCELRVELFSNIFGSIFQK